MDPAWSPGGGGGGWRAHLRPSGACRCLRLRSRHVGYKRLISTYFSRRTLGNGRRRQLAVMKRDSPPQPSVKEKQAPPPHLVSQASSARESPSASLGARTRAFSSLESCWHLARLSGKQAVSHRALDGAISTRFGQLFATPWFLLPPHPAIRLRELQNAACAASRSAKLPRGAHARTCSCPP